MIRKLISSTFLIFFLSVAIQGIFVEPDLLIVNEQELTFPGWPKSTNPFRIAALSDIHTGSPHVDVQKLREIVTKVNALQPDLVVLLGDYIIHGVVGGKFVEPEITARELKNFRSRYGTFAVLGNHDWWYDGERIRKALASSKMTVLDNEAVALNVNGSKIWILGIADYLTRTPEIEEPAKSIPSNEPIVAISHNPDIFPQVPERIRLTICGHTHGGQVLLPFLGRPLVPSLYGQRYGAGLIHEKNRDLFVTTGIGTSTFPLRFHVPPEIALLRISTTN